MQWYTHPEIYDSLDDEVGARNGENLHTWPPCPCIALWELGIDFDSCDRNLFQNIAIGMLVGTNIDYWVLLPQSAVLFCIGLVLDSVTSIR